MASVNHWLEVTFSFLSLTLPEMALEGGRYMKAVLMTMTARLKRCSQKGTGSKIRRNTAVQKLSVSQRSCVQGSLVFSASGRWRLRCRRVKDEAVNYLAVFGVPKRLRSCQACQPSGLSSLSTLVASRGRAGAAGVVR